MTAVANLPAGVSGGPRASGAGGERIRELDGFRGLAVLSIIVLHYIVHHLVTVPGAPLAYLQKYFLFLWVGVDAFFVLSGFLIGGILLDQYRSPNYFQAFYARRAFRIFPPYLLLLLAWVVADALLEGVRYGWILRPDFPLWPYVAYVQNFWMAAEGSTGPNFVAATWSLAVEEQFYLLMPLLVRWVPPVRLPWVLAGGILSAPVLRAGMAVSDGSWAEAQTRLLFTRWDSLLVGVAVAWVVRQPRMRARLEAIRGRLVALLLAMAGLMVAMPVLFALPVALTSPARAALGFLVIALFFGLLLLLLNLGALPRLARALSARWLRYLGKTSYFVYLFHTAILGLAFSLLLGKDPSLERGVDWLVTLAAFAVTLGIAEASWRLIEAPLLRRGHRHRYGSNASATAQVAG